MDAQLYPILTSNSDDSNELKLFTQEKLETVLSEIGKAKTEVQQRIDATLSLKAKDLETSEKIDQVKYNLNSIKTKLENISNDYRLLLEMIISFLENISYTRSEIEKYFSQKKSVSVESVYRDHEIFRETIMEQFRSLISQSEKIIDRIKDQEPPGSREYDAEKIISLLENLRLIFESENETVTSDIRKQSQISQFNKELNEINKNLNDLTRQLNDVKGQYGETSASAKASSLGFEYFERTIEVSTVFSIFSWLCKSYLLLI